VIAATSGVAVAVVGSVLCWLPDAGVSGKAGSAIRAGLLSFLAAQHGGITVDGVPARFLPLGLLLVVVYFAGRAGQSLAEAIDASAQPVPPARVLAALGLAAATYTGCCIALVALSRLGTSHAPPVATPVAAFVLFTLVAGVALWRSLGIELPVWLLTAGRGAFGAAALYLAGGALLAAGSLVLHFHRVTEISRQVGGGLTGLPVLVIGLLCAPNAAVAGAAYLAGPGFAVGSDTTVNAFSTTHGVLPALPVLGAIPDGHGANPVVLALMCLVPLLAATVVARVVRRSGVRGLGHQLAATAASGALTGLVLAVASWLGGGSAGTDRLRTVGASAWKVGLAVAATVAVLALLAVAVLALWDWLVPPRPAEADHTSDTRELVDAGTR
jgi:Family of unknown function (DUF6350)